VTDNEAICTAIVGGFTVLGAAVRLSAGVLKGVVARVVKAIDDSTAAWTKTSETVSMLTQKLVSIEAKLDVQRAVTEAVEEAVDEVSGVHEAAKPELSRRDTPRGGYAIQQPKRRAQTRGNGGVL
jgi:hypothetical protein